MQVYASPKSPGVFKSKHYDCHTLSEIHRNIVLYGGVGGKVLVVGGLQGWPVWEEVRDCPVLDTAGSTTDPLQDTAEPIGEVDGVPQKTYLRKGRKHQTERNIRKAENIRQRERRGEEE